MLVLLAFEIVKFAALIGVAVVIGIALGAFSSWAD